MIALAEVDSPLCAATHPHPQPNPAAHADAQRILTSALDLLSQGESLLRSVDPEVYGRRIPGAFNASMGGHYRHCLDHFHSWIAGIDRGMIDYDHRARDPRLETEPAAALDATLELRGRLAALAPSLLAQPVAARCEVSYDHGQSPVTPSSAGRELVYVIAHAIHHYALISVMAGMAGAVLPADFGVAPSTVAHRKSLAA